MDSWRLLTFGVYSAFMNMAIDETVLRARIEGQIPNTLRLYSWKPSAVSVGRFQNVENEVNLDECRREGVDVVRRISGGGTVYHDSKGEITYCLVAKTTDLGSTDVAVVYTRVYAGIVEALKMLGIVADFSPGNVKNCPNLTVRGKKISGSSQANRMGYTLQHGTLLLTVDLERMFTFLQVPWAKTRMEVVNVARERITSLEIERRPAIILQEFNSMLVKGFANTFGVEFQEADISPRELEFAEKLCKEKYSADEWNLGGKTSFS